MADEAVTSDRPISHLREDRLGHERVVRELSTTLATHGGTDSTDVALHGPWGRGKHSHRQMRYGMSCGSCDSSETCPVRDISLHSIARASQRHFPTNTKMGRRTSRRSFRLRLRSPNRFG